jgi:hypothetical protein
LLHGGYGELDRKPTGQFRGPDLLAGRGRERMGRDELSMCSPTSADRLGEVMNSRLRIICIWGFLMFQVVFCLWDGIMAGVFVHSAAPASVSFVYGMRSGALLISGVVLIQLAGAVVWQERRLQRLEQLMGQSPPAGQPPSPTGQGLDRL